MALNNYANFKTAVIDFHGSNDIANFVDDAISMAESSMYGNSSYPLRLRAMESRQTASADTTSRFLELPTDFLEMRRLKITTGDEHYEIEQRTPESMSSVTSSGRPKEFTVTTQLEFDRVPDSAYTLEMQLYKKLTALDSTNTTNSILTNHPNIYLFGCLWAINLRAAEEEKANFYWGRFIDEIKGANKQDRKGRYGAAPRMKIEGKTP